MSALQRKIRVQRKIHVEQFVEKEILAHTISEFRIELAIIFRNKTSASFSKWKIHIYIGEVSKKSRILSFFPPLNGKLLKCTLQICSWRGNQSAWNLREDYCYHEQLPWRQRERGHRLWLPN